MTESTEYKIYEGRHFHSFWTKKVAKLLKKSSHPWEDILKGLKSEFRFIEKARRKYSSKYDGITNCISNHCELVICDVSFPGVSAKRTGIRMALFIKKDKKGVWLLFVGHHKHYKQYQRGPEKQCIKKMVKDKYPEVAKDLQI